ncbi:unnamed protein product [Blepharisma stoltei]|uniref:Uncharacterized protein n=1 Tax=Blepharisma stoltei TaxID=1481888 RepID=A0AAU9KDF2_9CILI|nr:unnamed protein product [Blepharisma stoltei]
MQDNKKVIGLLPSLYKENCEQHFPTNKMHSYRQNSVFYEESCRGVLIENSNCILKNFNKITKKGSNISVSEASTNSTVSINKKRTPSVNPRKKKSETCIFSIIY